MLSPSRRAVARIPLGATSRIWVGEPLELADPVDRLSRDPPCATSSRFADDSNHVVEREPTEPGPAHSTLDLESVPFVERHETLIDPPGRPGREGGESCRSPTTKTSRTTMPAMTRRTVRKSRARDVEDNAAP